MNTKKEVLIACFVALFMIIVCIFVVALFNNKSQENVDLQVYVHEGALDGTGHYKFCNMKNEDLVKINRELNVFNNTKENMVEKTIKGYYKIVIDDDFYAFDNADDKIIYSGKDNAIYNFSSSIYSIIIEQCGSPME